MPIYEYKCSKCNHEFEKLESFNAKSVCTCPECGTTAKRMLSLGSFILKGSGWYATEHNARKNDKKETNTCDAACDTCCASAQKSA
jgi:putative FmdB family regulatory protein